ncbi:MAG TPA: S53 family peptidase, partial [Aliidongia sp.]|nr:S53 family peptidase [Aliidongia sp.]
YDPKSPSYHVWMSPEQVANFGPRWEDVAKMQTSLRALGLKIVRVSEDGTAIKVSGSADKIQAAFGTTIHAGNLAGRTVFANLTEPKYQGTNPELVDAVTGLSTAGMRPFAVRQLDFATGAPKPGIDLATTTNPLAGFTTNCFGGMAAATVSGQDAAGQNVTATFTGPQYLPVAAGATSQSQCGYTAAQLAAHYGLDAVHAKGWTGKGQTIVIVDAYGSQTLSADVNAFSQLMGLPALTNANLRVLYPDGQPNWAHTSPGLVNGWATETSLDVEWVHAMAPDAKIVLLAMPTEDDDELAYGISYAALHKLGNVISNSYGEAEARTGSATAKNFNSVIKKAAAEGIAVNVASGDSGDNGVGNPIGAAAIPEDSPYATAVGGTSIGVPSDHGPVDSAWGITIGNLGSDGWVNYPQTYPQFAQGSGGGESVFLPKPSFQTQLPGVGRQTPDVSALADPQTGAIIVVQSQLLVMGGTSLATPLFSAIWALADQAAGQSLGQAAPIIAKMTSNAIQDIQPIAANKINTSAMVNVQGGATASESPADLLGLSTTQPMGFVGALLNSDGSWLDVGFGADSSLTAAVGWDNATGWGQPKGLAFINEAINHAKKPNS